jgi:O-antigen/teichoic acid export membrane protein
VTSSGEGVREGLSSVTQGTLFLLVASLLYVAINFVARVLVVRNITPDQYSAYSLGLTMSGVAAAIGTLGLPSAIARSLPFHASDPERRAMVRATLVLGGGAGVGGSVLLFLLAGPIGRALASASLGAGTLTLSIQFFSISVASSVIGTLIAAVFQGYEDVTPNALFLNTINPALYVVFLGAVLALPAHTLNFFDALVTYAVAQVATVVLLAVYLVRRLPKKLPTGPRDPKAVRPYLWFAVPLFVVSVMSTLTGSGDTLILGIYHSSEVGTYSASLTLARLLQVGVSAASYIFLPVAAKFLRRNDTGSIELTFTTVTKWMIVFSLPLFLLFFFLPSESLGFVYGSKYTLVTLPLDLAVAGAFLTTLLGPAPTVQVAYGHTRLLAYNAIVAGILDVGIAFLLVPTYGWVGAAIAWGTANAAYSVLSLVEIAWMDRIHPFRQHFVLPLVLTGVPVGLVLGILHPRVALWALPPIGLAVAGLFVLLVLVTRSVDVGDAMLLDTVERLVGRPLPFVRRLGRLALRRHRLE